MKSIIGVDRSQTEVKLVELDLSAKLPKLLNFALIKLPSDNDLETVKYVKDVSSSYGFKGKEVSIAGSSVSSDYRILELPPTSKKNMNQLINQQIKASAQDAKGELAIGYKVVGKKSVSGLEKNEVLVVSSPQESMRGLTSLVDSVGWKTRLVTTSSLAILSLARLHPSFDPKSLVAVIYIGGDAGHLVIGMDEKVFYPRDIAFPYEKPEDRAEKFAVEINRAILYFGQRAENRGQISRIFVCANRDVIPSLSVALQSVLDQQLEIVDLSLLLDLSPLGGRALEFESLAESFSISIGAALELTRDLPLSLLPKQVKERSAQPIVKVNLIIISMVAATILILSSTQFYILKTKANYVKLSNEQLRKLEESKPLLQEIEMAQKERDIYQQKQRFLKEFTPGGDWESTLNMIATTIPPNVSLIALDISRKGDRWNISLKGQSESEKIYSAFSEVNRFYYDFRQLPFFENAKMEPPKVSSPFRSNQPSLDITQTVASEKEETIILNFEIQASLKSKPFKLSELFQKNEASEAPVK